MPIFRPKKQFLLSGSNMNFVKNVYFGGEIVTGLGYIETTGLSGIVPAAAFTAPLTLETNSNVIDTNPAQVILDSASQVVVSGLDSDNVSGKIGDVITLSGENFYQITDIKFGDTSSVFSVISPSQAQASVPADADYNGISVLSSIRTGLNNSTSESSGISNNEFVPVPEISTLNSGQLNSGETLIISGASFKAVTGVKINDIEMESVTVNSSSELQMTVASGNVRGVPNLLTQSGVSISAPSTVTFSPLAKITGVQTGVELGSTIAISGTNFTSDILYSGMGHEEYLVQIGDQTGNFKIVDDEKMTGVAPTGLSISVSGNLADNEPKISSHSVFLYSNNYPEQYPSEFSFTPAIGSPTITSINPLSGVAGDEVTVVGTNLYAMTGFSIGNVGFGTQTTNLNTITEGSEVSFVIPSASYSTGGASLELKLSGYYGAVSAGGGVNILGDPNIDSFYPSSNVEPGSTGTIYGANLYSGTEVFLQNGSVNPQFFISYLDISGYKNNNEIVFYYPDRFETGVDYRLRVRNRRGVDGIESFTSRKAPVISGFSPLSGEYGETITISGYFETIKESGLKVGNTVANEFTQNSTTGIDMTIPQYSLSDIITIDTVGGFISDSGILGVSPNKPSISGFYPGAFDFTGSFDQEAVFGEGNLMTITGERINLVTGVIFSGDSGEIAVSEFSRKSPNSLVINVPQFINSGSGQFLTRDFQSRETTSPFDINITRISGFNNFLKAGAALSLSGENVSGLRVGFGNPTGGYIYKDAISTSVGMGTSASIDTITVEVPTGIQAKEIVLTGRSNTNIETTFQQFLPLSLISGVSGILPTPQSATTGTHFRVTGLNLFNKTLGGEVAPYLLGITGTGNHDQRAEVQFLPASGFSSGVDGGVFYQAFESNFPTSFIGSGQLFITNPWDKTYNPALASAEVGLAGSASESYLSSQLSYFDDEFIINGTRVNATGYAPQRGVTGSSVEISGEGFSHVSGVFFRIPEGPYLEADFTLNSANKITVTVPVDGIESRGSTKLILSGGTNDTVGDFEVILDASVVEFNINNEDDTPTSSSRVGNFTQRETIAGDVYLVTRTRFPDGTTAVISSVPEG